MADDEAPGLDLGRKIGPLPLYAWIGAAAALAFILYRALGLKAVADKGSGKGGPGAGNTFSNTRTTTGTDAEGRQYSDSFTAQGNGYLPGMLSTGASPMPYSGGDVYVNYPSNPQAPEPPEQAGPPAPATPTSPYVTTDVQHPHGIRDNNALGLAVLSYGLKNDQEQDAIIGATQIVAANPQINWAKAIPRGTTINIPLRWIAGVFKDQDTPYNQGDNRPEPPAGVTATPIIGQGFQSV